MTVQYTPKPNTKGIFNMTGPSKLSPKAEHNLKTAGSYGAGVVVGSMLGGPVGAILGGGIVWGWRKWQNKDMAKPAPHLVGRKAKDGSTVPPGSVQDPKSGIVQYPDGSLHAV